MVDGDEDNNKAETIDDNKDKIETTSKIETGDDYEDEVEALNLILIQLSRVCNKNHYTKY